MLGHAWQHTRPNAFCCLHALVALPHWVADRHVGRLGAPLAAIATLRSYEAFHPCICLRLGIAVHGGCTALESANRAS